MRTLLPLSLLALTLAPLAAAAQDDATTTDATAAAQTDTQRPRSRFYARVTPYLSIMPLSDRHADPVEEESGDFGEALGQIIREVMFSSSPQVGFGLSLITGIPVGRRNHHIETGLTLQVVWPSFLLGVSVPLCYTYRFGLARDRLTLQPIGGLNMRVWAGGDVADGTGVRRGQLALRLGAAFSAGHFSLAYMALPGITPFTHNGVRCTEHQVHLGWDIHKKRDRRKG